MSLLSLFRRSTAALGIVVAIAAPAMAATPVPMASNLSYTENFADITNWTNGFASGIGASRFGSVTVNAGSIPGTTDTTTSTAIDFFMDFTGTTAGSLSYDWAEVNNSTGDRVGTVRVYASTDGASWSELATAAKSVTNNVASSGNVSVALPASFNNNAGARLRFYYHNGSGGSTGSRPKFSIDNLNVTATLTYGITASAGANGSISPNGVTTVNSGASQSYTITPDPGYHVADVLVDGVS